MIALLIYVLVLWLAWRWLCRWSASQYVEIVPPAPTTINVVTPSITIHVHLQTQKPRTVIDPGPE